VFTANSYAKLALALTLSEGAGERATAAQQAADRGIRALGLTLVHQPVAQPVVPAQTALLRREGEYWSIEFGAGATRVKDTVGLRHLARLLTEPGREFHVLDLVGYAGPPDDAGPVLDARAKTTYRQRLTDLAEDLIEAENFADRVRAERLRVEIDALTEQLAGAVGLGGHDRRAAAVTERARSAVTKAIKSTITRIAVGHPSLGGHLRTAVRTGTYCTYQPDPTATLDWHVLM
jgi:non-specific serine/threonine protein kinase